MPSEGVVLIAILVILASAMKILRMWERGVIMRLGQFQAVRGPGAILVIPMIERLYRVSTRVVVVDIPLQDIVTEDNIMIEGNASVFFHVSRPKEAVLEVEDYYAETTGKAEVALRNVLGEFTFTNLHDRRDTINQRVQSVLDAETARWGVTVDTVEIKQVDRTKGV